MLIDKSDKWKAVSHLQKCIRRGWGERIDDVAQALWNVDNAYLRYRLAVISMEDIGIANPDTLDELMQDKINKRWVNANGGISGLLSRMKTLANGCKDRTPCTWGSLASRGAFEEVHGNWATASTQNAIDIAWDSKQSMPVRGAAVLRATGTDIFPHKDFPEQSGDWEQWIEANSPHCPQNITTLMRLGQKTQKEWHAAFLGLCWQNNNQNPGLTTQVSPRDWGDVHGYCSAAIDIHTSEGRRSIQDWWRGTYSLRQEWASMGWARPEGDTISALASMIFLIEGGAVDKRLNYPLAIEAERLSKELWVMRTGLPGKEAASVVWRLMPQLHEYRLKNVRPALELSSKTILDM